MVDELQMFTETTGGKPADKWHQGLKGPKKEGQPKDPKTFSGKKREPIGQDDTTDNGNRKAIHGQCNSQQPDIQKVHILFVCLFLILWLQNNNFFLR